MRGNRSKLIINIILNLIHTPEWRRFGLCSLLYLCIFYTNVPKTLNLGPLSTETYSMNKLGFSIKKDGLLIFQIFRLTCSLPRYKFMKFWINNIYIYIIYIYNIYKIIYIKIYIWYMYIYILYITIFYKYILNIPYII